MRLRKEIYGLFLLFVGLLISCSGGIDVPEPAEDSPVFTANLSFDQDTLGWQAGRQGYEARASYNITGSRLTFMSQMRPKDCGVACPHSLNVRLISAVDYNRNFSMDRALTIGPKNLSQVREADSLIAVFQNRSKNFSSTGNWFIDGRRVMPKNMNDTLLLQIEKKANFELCLEQEDDERVFFRQCQKVGAGKWRAPRTTIKVTADRQYVTMEAVLNPDFDVREVEGTWNNRSGTNPTLKVELGKIINTEWCYQTKHRLTNNTSTSCVRFSRPPTSDLRSVLDFEIDRVIEPAPQIIPMNNEAEINYFNQDGKRFSTVFSDSGMNRFEIVSIEDFNDQVVNQQFKKVRCLFSGELVSRDGERRRVRNAQLILPFSIVE